MEEQLATRAPITLVKWWKEIMKEGHCPFCTYYPRIGTVNRFAAVREHVRTGHGTIIDDLRLDEVNA